MATFTMRHDIDCGPERFWEMFFDNELQKRIFLTELGFTKWELVDHNDSPTEISRTVRAVPKLDMPGPVAKVLGSGFGYTEEGRFDKAQKVFRFVVKPSTLADKLKMEGKVTCEPKGDGKCTRVVEVTQEAKIFGVGGMIEKMTEKNLRDGWGKGAEVFNEHLKKTAG